MRRMSLREYSRRRRIETFLSLLEASHYNLDIFKEKLNQLREHYQTLKKEAKNGIIRDRSIFRVELPTFYIDKYDKRLKELEYYETLAKELYECANHLGYFKDYYEAYYLHLKETFRGYIKRMKKAIEALRES